MMKPVPLFSRKAAHKWAGPPHRRPGGLDPDPMATLAEARKRGSKAETSEDESSSGSESSNPYDLNTHKKGVSAGRSEKSVTIQIPKAVRRKGGGSGGSQTTNRSTSEESSPSDDDSRLTLNRVVKGTNTTVEDYANRITEIY